MVVDIGGGTTEVAILASAASSRRASVRVAGDALDLAIVENVPRRVRLLIGDRTAEELKISVGSAFPAAGPKNAEIRGRDVATGLPRNVTISGEQLRKYLDGPLTRIIAAIRATLDRLPTRAGRRSRRPRDRAHRRRRAAARHRRPLEHELGVPVLVADARSTRSCSAPPRSSSTSEQLHKVVVDGPRR